MRQTTNYNLQKPDYNNVADIEVLNGNFDILDSELKKKAGEAEVNDAIRQLDIDNRLNSKVDKEPGKGLSSNDYTTPEKGKLGALPTKSQLDNLLDRKVDKVPGMGLSKNSFSDAEKEKLAGLYNTPIVDNLTDGGRDKALSAEQGKILFYTVVDGKHAVATAINDVAKKTVANKYMTHQQLADKIKSVAVPLDIFKFLVMCPITMWKHQTLFSHEEIEIDYRNHPDPYYEFRYRLSAEKGLYVLYMTAGRIGVNTIRVSGLDYNNDILAETPLVLNASSYYDSPGVSPGMYFALYVNSSKTLNLNFRILLQDSWRPGSGTTLKEGCITIYRVINYNKFK